MHSCFARVPHARVLGRRATARRARPLAAAAGLAASRFAFAARGDEAEQRTGNRQFARVVKGVDLRSTGGNSARVRTPQLTKCVFARRDLPRAQSEVIERTLPRAPVVTRACHGKSDASGKWSREACGGPFARRMRARRRAPAVAVIAVRKWSREACRRARKRPCGG